MRALLLITLLAACSKSNPYYCPDNPDDNCLVDADINMPMGCTSSTECTNAAKPICETMEKVCVACTAADVGACSGTTPVCSATNTCTGCTAHSECESAVCLPDGSCAASSQVAYVSAAGEDANTCALTQPCKKISYGATKGVPYIKVLNDLDEAVLLDGVNVTIVAEPGVAVRRTSMGSVFDLRGTSTITIRDLTIRDASGTTGNGVLVGPGEPVNLTLDRVYVLGNAATGVNAQGGTLTISRSVVAANTGGGIVVATQFNISNSLFVANGSPSSLYGGVTLTPSGTVSFKFNTVVNNSSSTGPKGMNCTVPITSSNTIVSSNDVGSNCAFEYSLFDTTVSVSGTNRTGDPKFKNTNVTNPRAPDFYRIQSASDAVDKADPASTMMTDIDGDERPQGNAPDIGADEFK